MNTLLAEAEALMGREEYDQAARHGSLRLSE